MRRIKTGSGVFWEDDIQYRGVEYRLIVHIPWFAEFWRMQAIGTFLSPLSGREITETRNVFERYSLSQDLEPVVDWDTLTVHPYGCKNQDPMVTPLHGMPQEYYFIEVNLKRSIYIDVHVHAFTERWEDFDNLEKYIAISLGNRKEKTLLWDKAGSSLDVAEFYSRVTDNYFQLLNPRTAIYHDCIAMCNWNFYMPGVSFDKHADIRSKIELTRRYILAHCDKNYMKDLRKQYQRKRI